ncbi:MAG: hypothetical protein KDD67_03190 [Ignavibacteriae bacterium]|nr:hypothetical protein [Ignavibacteriota bacterium]MCB9217164.1 hypothetical protein [Ignavibacteria bacterium]
MSKVKAGAWGGASPGLHKRAERERKVGETPRGARERSEALTARGGTPKAKSRDEAAFHVSVA